MEATIYGLGFRVETDSNAGKDKQSWPEDSRRDFRQSGKEAMDRNMAGSQQ